MGVGGGGARSPLVACPASLARTCVFCSLVCFSPKLGNSAVSRSSKKPFFYISKNKKGFISSVKGKEWTKMN